MPVKASKKIEFAVGDEVIMDLNGVDTPSTILKLKGDNYLVEDGEGTEYECEPHELKPKAAKAKSKPEPEEEVEDEKPKKAAKKPAADEGETEKEVAAPKKGSGWASAKPITKKDIGLPIGTWEGLVFDGGVTEKGKGVGTFLDVVGVNDEAVTGVQQRKFYTIKDDKGNWNDEGIGYFKSDLLDIGFTQDQIDAIDQDDIVEDLSKLLKKVRKMEPWVTLKVKKGKEGYSNTVYINGLMDDQEQKPENPLVS